MCLSGKELLCRYVVQDSSPVAPPTYIHACIHIHIDRDTHRGIHIQTHTNTDRLVYTHCSQNQQLHG